MQILGATDITMPDQSFNAVDVPYLFEEDGITDRVKGSRNGGDLTFNVNAYSTDDAGLGKLLEANLDQTSESQIEITFSNGAKALIERVVVLNCSLQNIQKDAVLSYAVSCACNSVVQYTNA